MFVPERLLRHTLAQIHYMPDNWKGNAHKLHVSKELSQLFQLKIVSDCFDCTCTGISCIQ